MVSRTKLKRFKHDYRLKSVNGARRRGLTEEQRKILEKIHEGVDYVLKTHKES